MSTTTILFDLDDTLTNDTAAVEAAFLSTGKLAYERHGIQPASLSQVVRTVAQQLWRASSTITYCRAVGISSWEGLSACFLGDDPCLGILREWMLVYRYQAWSSALSRFGIEDSSLAEELAYRYTQERLLHQVTFPEVKPVLEALQTMYRLGLITNGSPDLQRGKLRKAQLEDYFDVVIISGEVGVGKPDPGIFQLALDRIGTSPAEAVMVGDSIDHDIAGAHNTGLKGILVDRSSLTNDGKRIPEPDGTIPDLTHLTAVLEYLSDSV